MVAGVTDVSYIMEKQMMKVVMVAPAKLVMELLAA